MIPPKLTMIPVRSQWGHYVIVISPINIHEQHDITPNVPEVVPQSPDRSLWSERCDPGYDWLRQEGRQNVNDAAANVRTSGFRGGFWSHFFGATDEEQMDEHEEQGYAKWCPRTIVKLVHITPILMVYGTYNYS